MMVEKCTNAACPMCQPGTIGEPPKTNWKRETATALHEAERRGMMRAAEIADDPAHTLPADVMPVRALPLDERSFRAGYDAAQRDVAQAIESAATDAKAEG